jgi:hypothetical protein
MQHYAVMPGRGHLQRQVWVHPVRRAHHRRGAGMISAATAGAITALAAAAAVSLPASPCSQSGLRRAARTPGATPVQGLIRKDGSGLATFRVQFSCVAFRPFKGEVMDCVVTNVNKVRSLGGRPLLPRRRGM